MNDNPEKTSKDFFYRPAIIVLAITFFFLTASFSFFTQKGDFVKWISPDETANYTFAKIYAQEGKLTMFEKYNLYVNDVIHPRSMRSDAGHIKPVSFLGIILVYGKIASLFGYKILPFLTPFFGAVGIIFFYLLAEKIFGKENAFFSSLLLASFPVYIFYSARSMFHNILFLSFLIVGFYFLFLMTKRKQKMKEYDNLSCARDVGIREHANLFFAGLAGVFLGLAIITRTSELIWVVPALFILLVFNIKNLNFLKIFLFASGLFLAILPVLSWNKVLYDNFFYGGYPEMNRSIVDIAKTSLDITGQTIAGQVEQIKISVNRLGNDIFFFGFHPRESIKRMYYYFANMFPWIFWPAVAGIVIFFSDWKKVKRKHIAFFATAGVISLILLFYYGSWKFNDNPDPNSFTIGNSYTRYWLPIYLASLPFVSFFILKTTSWLRSSYFVVLGRVLFMAIIFFVSIKFVLVGSEEGLLIIASKQKSWHDELATIENMTENNAVIITRYHDKLIFPERKVVVGLFDNDMMLGEYSKLVDYLPVYYYNFTLPQKDMEFLNQRRLVGYNLKIESVKDVTKDFTLYKIARTDRK